MNITCPGCHAEMTLDVLIAHEEARVLVGQLLERGMGLGSVSMRYIALFRPDKRRMSIERMCRLCLAPASSASAGLQRPQQGRVGHPGGQCRPPPATRRWPARRQRWHQRNRPVCGRRRHLMHAPTIQAQLLNTLAAHRGRDKGIGARELARQLKTTPRTLRLLISRCREQGTAICGKPSSGYFVPTNDQELVESCEFLIQRAKKSLLLASRMRNVAMPALLGQMFINQA